VVDVILGFSRSIRRPVGSESIVSRSLSMKKGEAVASPRAAIISTLSVYSMYMGIDLLAMDYKVT
jgi:hypothetical protein